MKQIDEWEADDNIFFRVTEKNRLHQQYSTVVGEEPAIRDTLDNRTRKRIEQEIEDGTLADDKVAELDRQLREGEIDDFVYAKEHGELVAETTIEYYEEYCEDVLSSVVDEMGVPMGIKEVFAEGQNTLIYPGPNATERLIGVNQALNIASRSGWDWPNRQGMDAPVIHVIRGYKTSVTYDADGIVIVPEETVAVFDWSDEFQEAVMQMEDDAFQAAALSPGD